MLTRHAFVTGVDPILPELTLPDGRAWKNLSNPRVARVAQELDDFRARFAYNLEDSHVRALAAEVPIIAQWDDHETHNNWWPGQVLDDDRYLERNASLLSAFARQAAFEWTPIGRGAGAPSVIQRVISYGPLLDVVVVDLRSFRTRAKWKIVACDQPLGLVIPDGPNGEREEGYGNGEGPPLGGELELATVLSGLAARGVKNVAWLTADVHCAAAHHYDPDRATPGAGSAPFRAFWEFIAGPLRAVTGEPKPLDPTFGPELRFQWAAPAGHGLAPWDGLQNACSARSSRTAAGSTSFSTSGFCGSSGCPWKIYLRSGGPPLELFAETRQRGFEDQLPESLRAQLTRLQTQGTARA